jgi:hypothetical protein
MYRKQVRTRSSSSSAGSKYRGLSAFRRLPHTTRKNSSLRSPRGSSSPSSTPASIDRRDQHTIQRRERGTGQVTCFAERQRPGSRTRRDAREMRASNSQSAATVSAPLPHSDPSQRIQSPSRPSDSCCVRPIIPDSPVANAQGHRQKSINETAVITSLCEVRSISKPSPKPARQTDTGHPEQASVPQARRTAQRGTGRHAYSFCE